MTMILDPERYPTADDPWTESMVRAVVHPAGCALCGSDLIITTSDDGATWSYGCAEDCDPEVVDTIYRAAAALEAEEEAAYLAAVAPLWADMAAARPAVEDTDEEGTTPEDDEPGVCGESKVVWYDWRTGGTYSKGPRCNLPFHCIRCATFRVGTRGDDGSIDGGSHAWLRQYDLQERRGGVALFGRGPDLFWQPVYVGPKARGRQEDVNPELRSTTARAKKAMVKRRAAGEEAWLYRIDAHGFAHFFTTWDVHRPGRVGNKGQRMGNEMASRPITREHARRLVLDELLVPLVLQKKPAHAAGFPWPLIKNDKKMNQVYRGEDIYPDVLEAVAESEAVVSVSVRERDGELVGAAADPDPFDLADGDDVVVDMFTLNDPDDDASLAPVQLGMVTAELEVEVLRRFDVAWEQMLAGGLPKSRWARIMPAVFRELRAEVGREVEAAAARQAAMRVKAA